MYILGFVTCSATKLDCYFPTIAEPDFLPTEPPFTPDDHLVVEHLRSMGHSVEPVVWGAPVGELSDFDALVMRSPWDYMDTDESRNRFLVWLNALRQASLPVHNSPDLMLWLGDKRYLADFRSVAVPIVPTRFLPRGTDLETLSFDYPAVLKPAISGAAQGLYFLGSGADDRSGLRDALANNAYLLQDFIPEIKTLGEWSLVYIDGTFSHAVHKRPGCGSILVHAEQGGTLSFAAPPDAVKLFGDRVMEALARACQVGTGRRPQTPLYLRIDVLPSSQGLLLSECEGVEPELFFRVRPESVGLFCEALLNRL